MPRASFAAGSDDAVAGCTSTPAKQTAAPDGFDVRACWTTGLCSGWPGASFLGISGRSTYGTIAVFEEPDVEAPDRVWVTEPNISSAPLSSGGSLLGSEKLVTRASCSTVESRRDEERELFRRGEPEPNRGLPPLGDDAALPRCCESSLPAAASAARAAAMAMATASGFGTGGIGGGTGTGASFAPEIGRAHV